MFKAKWIPVVVGGREFKFFVQSKKVENNRKVIKVQDFPA